MWKRGKIDEITDISVDYFKGDENLKSVAYFVSHCHMDHLDGLSGSDFESRLGKEDDIYIYCSELSAAILRVMYPGLTQYLKVLDVREPNNVCLRGNDKLLVTLVPAGHSIGSVMFLFEYGDKRVLYTGDFRLNPTDLNKFKCFLDDRRNVIAIDNIYLDTTFFQKCYKYFPPREQAVIELTKLINSWISISDKHIVYLDAPARYSYENLFIELSRRLRMPICVDGAVYDIYKCIPQLDDAVTKDLSQTKVCAGNWAYANQFEYKSLAVKRIRASAMKWRSLRPEDPIVVDDSTCYSTHSSYDEIVQFLDYLRPKQITPCVEQRRSDDHQEMMQSIEELSKKYNDKPKAAKASVRSNPRWIHDVSPQKITPNKPVCETDEDDDISSILDSPDRNKRRKLLL